MKFGGWILRSGVTVGGVILILLGFGSFVLFPEAGGVSGFSLALLTSGAMIFLGFVLLIAGLAASSSSQESTQKPEVSIDSKTDRLDKLEKLNNLREEGAINEEEFKKMKQEILQSE